MLTYLKHDESVREGETLPIPPGVVHANVGQNITPPPSHGGGCGGGGGGGGGEGGGKGAGKGADGDGRHWQ